MVDLIAQYRQDVETLLRAKVSPYEAQMIAEEIEQHLRERVVASQELGSSPETAQLEALAAMGPTTELAKEFLTQVPRRFELSPRAGNWAMLVALAMVPVAQQQFLRNEGFNMLVVASWFVVPAFCRKFPTLGMLVGFAMIELFVIIPQGTANPAYDVSGMAMLGAMALAAFWIGRLIRKIKIRKILRLVK